MAREAVSSGSSGEGNSNKDGEAQLSGHGAVESRLTVESATRPPEVSSSKTATSNHSATLAMSASATMADGESSMNSEATQPDNEVRCSSNDASANDGSLSSAGEGIWTKKSIKKATVSEANLDAVSFTVDCCACET